MNPNPAELANFLLMAHRCTIENHYTVAAGKWKIAVREFGLVDRDTLEFLSKEHADRVIDKQGVLVVMMDTCGLSFDVWETLYYRLHRKDIPHAETHFTFNTDRITGVRKT